MTICLKMSTACLTFNIHVHFLDKTVFVACGIATLQ